MKKIYPLKCVSSWWGLPYLWSLPSPGIFGLSTNSLMSNLNSRVFKYILSCFNFNKCCMIMHKAGTPSFVLFSLIAAPHCTGPLLASKQGSSIPKHAHSTKDFWTPSSYLNSQAASAFLASQTLSWSPTCMHSVFHNSPWGTVFFRNTQLSWLVKKNGSNCPRISSDLSYKGCMHLNTPRTCRLLVRNG